MPKKQNRKVGKQKKATPGSNVRPESKQNVMIQLLRRPEGVTLQELMDASGWQAHSVRGFISGALGKKMGLPVASTRREDGQRVYRIA